MPQRHPRGGGQPGGGGAKVGQASQPKPPRRILREIERMGPYPRPATKPTSSPQHNPHKPQQQSDDKQGERKVIHATQPHRLQQLRPQNEKRSLGRSPVSEAPSHRAMTAAAGMVTRTAVQIILVESVALGCDVWVTGDEKSGAPEAR